MEENNKEKEKKKEIEIEKEVPEAPAVDLNELQKKKNEEKRSRVVKELYDTEVSYVTSLMVVSNCFVKQIEEQELLKVEERKEIFSNIASLLGVHKEFLKMLREKVNAWS